MKPLGTLAVAGAIVASTYFAIAAIADHKADVLAGGESHTLDRTHEEEWRAFSSLLGQLRAWGEDDLATSLAELQHEGHLRVAPRLGGDRSAIYVDSLGLVRRIYVRRQELLARTLPFPELDVPDSAQRTFATIRLAGTLYHELQHYEGLEDERATYEREIGWYEALGEAAHGEPEGERRRWFEWAVESALASAEAARDKATGAEGHAVRTTPRATGAAGSALAR